MMSCHLTLHRMGLDNHKSVKQKKYQV